MQILRGSLITLNTLKEFKNILSSQKIQKLDDLNHRLSEVCKRYASCTTGLNHATHLTLQCTLLFTK